MGAEHGGFCLGCYRALMLLLFVAGVMNLLWVALISMFVLAEKLAPNGILPGRVCGLAMIVLGIMLGTAAALPRMATGILYPRDDYQLPDQPKQLRMIRRSSCLESSRIS